MLREGGRREREREGGRRITFQFTCLSRLRRERGEGRETTSAEQAGRQARVGRWSVLSTPSVVSSRSGGRKEGRKELADELKARKIRKI